MGALALWIALKVMLSNTGHTLLSQVVLVMGKGGVGKTTVATGLAAAAATTGQATVLVEFMDGESGARMLGRHIDGAPRSTIAQEVIEPHHAIETLTQQLFRSQLLARFVTGNFAMKRLFRAAPALRELAQLDAIRAIADKDVGRRVVVDMPATGHGIAWLRVASQLETLLLSGPLHKVARRLSKDFLIPSRCSVVLVTLPEEMVLRETTELAHAMDQEVNLAPACIVINRVPPAIPDGAIETAEAWTQQDSPIADAARHFVEWLRVRDAARRQTQERLQASALKDLHSITLPLTAVDPTPQEVAGWFHEAGVR